MTNKTRSILLAAVLATPVVFFTKPAEAQNRIDNGAALDANNRIGSGGTNTGHDLRINSTDSLITGNTTGGRQFRGNVASTDPKAFRGNLNTPSDNLIRQSASAYDNNAQSVRQYYGNNYGAPPPTGFKESTLGSQAFVPAPPPSRGAGDVRMGDIYTSDRTAFSAPQFGELMAPGQVDNSNSQSLLRASPLYGVVQEDRQQLTDPTEPGTQSFRRRSNIPGLEDKQLQAARDELRRTADNANANPNDPNAKIKPGDEQNLGAKTLIGAPQESPLSPALPGSSLNSPLKNQALDGQIKSEASQRNELIPPAEQSTQYADLYNRAKNRRTGPMTDQQSANQFNQDLALRQKDVNARKGETGSSTNSRAGSGSGRVTFPGNSGGITGVGTTPPAAKTNEPSGQGTTPAPEANPVESQTKAPPAVARNATGDQGPVLNPEGFRAGEPVKISSLTDGMKPSRLKDTLGAAEDLMRQGKYTGAIDQYDFAERVAPNNPMITMGRANAELGASYYARAESNIRRGLAADNGTMMAAQFDLNKFLGKDRVAFLEKDLKEITTTEPKQARAPFLLAYLKYHTGDKKMAANYLALSEQRLGKEDPLYKQMRLTWDLPKADPLPDAGDANK